MTTSIIKNLKLFFQRCVLDNPRSPSDRFFRILNMEAISQKILKQYMAGKLWLAGWLLAGCWLVCWLAGCWLAGLLTAGWLSGYLAAGWLAAKIRGTEYKQQD